MVGAKLLGRPVRFPSRQDHRPSSRGDSRLVIRPDQLDAVLATIDLAKKEVYFHGLVTVKQILRAIPPPLAVRNQAQRTWCGKP